MIDQREVNEYNFIRSKFDVSMKEWEKVYKTFHLLSSKNIYLNNAVLELFYTYIKDLDYYLISINLLYNTFDHQLDFGFDDIGLIATVLNGLSRNYDSNMKYYNDLDDVLKFVSELKFDSTDYGEKVHIIHSLIGFYWLNREQMKLNDINDFINHIINDNYLDIFINNGIIDKKGKIVIKKNELIEYLNNLFKNNNLIIKK